MRGGDDMTKTYEDMRKDYLLFIDSISLKSKGLHTFDKVKIDRIDEVRCPHCFYINDLYVSHCSHLVEIQRECVVFGDIPLSDRDLNEVIRLHGECKCRGYYD